MKGEELQGKILQTIEDNTQWDAWDAFTILNQNESNISHPYVRLDVFEQELDGHFNLTAWDGYAYLNFFDDESANSTYNNDFVDENDDTLLGSQRLKTMVADVVDALEQNPITVSGYNITFTDIIRKRFFVESFSDKTARRCFMVVRFHVTE